MLATAHHEAGHAAALIELGRGADIYHIEVCPDRGSVSVAST